MLLAECCWLPRCFGLSRRPSQGRLLEPEGSRRSVCLKAMLSSTYAERPVVPHGILQAWLLGRECEGSPSRHLAAFPVRALGTGFCDT